MWISENLHDAAGKIKNILRVRVRCLLIPRLKVISFSAPHALLLMSENLLHS